MELNLAFLHLTVPLYTAEPIETAVLSREAKFFAGDYDLLWRTKLTQCTPKFRAHVKEHGVLTPVVLERIDKAWTIDIFDNLLETTWQLCEGHHRWALAMALEIPVPYVIRQELPAGVMARHLEQGFTRPWADGTTA